MKISLNFVSGRDAVKHITLMILFLCWLLRVAGFCLAKGISPLLPIFRESILNGAPELKEQAAQAWETYTHITCS